MDPLGASRCSEESALSPSEESDLIRVAAGIHAALIRIRDDGLFDVDPGELTDLVRSGRYLRRFSRPPTASAFRTSGCLDAFFRVLRRCVHNSCSLDTRPRARWLTLGRDVGSYLHCNYSARRDADPVRVAELRGLFSVHGMFREPLGMEVVGDDGYLCDDWSDEVHSDGGSDGGSEASSWRWEALEEVREGGAAVGIGGNGLGCSPSGSDSVTDNRGGGRVEECGPSASEEGGLMDRAFRLLREYQALRSYLEDSGRGRVLEQFYNFLAEEYRVRRHPFFPYTSAVVDQMTL